MNLYMSTIVKLWLYYLKLAYFIHTGILKKSSTSLEPVPEFAESPIQRADSNLEIVESEVRV